MKMMHNVATRKLTSNQRTQSAYRLMVIEDALAEIFASPDQDALSTLTAMVSIAAARVESII